MFFLCVAAKDAILGSQVSPVPLELNTLCWNPSERWQTGTPRLCQILHADKNKIPGLLPKPWVTPTAWACASYRVLSGRDTAASQAGAALSHLSGWGRAAVLALCWCYHRDEERRVGRRTSLCSTSVLTSVQVSAKKTDMDLTSQCDKGV